MIEVEIRSFIDDDQYRRLDYFFSKNAKLIVDDEQETHHLSGEKDLRIQKNSRHSKIWMKGGKIHDDQRDELELKMETEKFPLLEKLFRELGYETEIKWFRKRKEYEWNGITVCLDDTRGYGKIIELEKMIDSDDKEKTLELLKSRMNDLNVTLTPKEEFNEKYEDYKKNWKKRTEE